MKKLINSIIISVLFFICLGLILFSPFSSTQTNGNIYNSSGSYIRSGNSTTKEFFPKEHTFDFAVDQLLEFKIASVNDDNTFKFVIEDLNANKILYSKSSKNLTLSLRKKLKAGKYKIYLEKNSEPIKFNYLLSLTDTTAYSSTGQKGSSFDYLN